MRGDGSGRPALDQDPVVRIPRELFSEPGVTLGIIRVYAALRRRAGFEPAAENFLLCWPSVETVARDAGVHRATVISAIDFLHTRDFFVRSRRPNRSNMFMLIVHRAWFREMTNRYGRHRAIEEFESWRIAQDRPSRQGQAKAARQREQQHADEAQFSGRKSPPHDRPREGDDWQSSAFDLPGRPGTTSGVACMRPRTVDQKNCVTENRGATVVALPPALQDQEKKAQSNSYGPVAALAQAVKRMPAAKPMTPEEREARIRELRRMTRGWKQS